MDIEEFTDYQSALKFAKKLATEGRDVSLVRKGELWVASINNYDETYQNQSNKLKVFKFPATGEVVVFDDEMQIPNSTGIYGFASKSCEVTKILEPKIREYGIDATVDEKNIAIKKYLNWKKSEFDKHHKEESKEIEVFSRTIAKRHRAFIENRGLNYTGSRNSTKKHRSSHCYSCGGSVDSDCNLECNTCNWLICSCGACGCGYMR